MNQKRPVRHLIHGILRTTTDFNVTAFGQSFFDINKMRVIVGPPEDKKDKYPCTRTVKLPVLNNQMEQAEAEETLIPADAGMETFHNELVEGESTAVNAADDKAVADVANTNPPRKYSIVLLPVVPSTVLRGRLRREMTEVVLDIIEKRGDLIDLGTARGLTSGNASGSPDGVGATFEQITEAQKSPLLGLFGGGPKMIPSGLVTCTGYPICDATLNIGMVPAAFEAQKNDASPAKMTTVRVRVHKDDTIGGGMGTDLGGSLDLRLLRRVKDAPKAIADWLRELRGGKADDAEKPEGAVEGGGTAEATPNEEGGRSNQKVGNIFCTESVIPGVNFYIRFIVDTEVLDLAGLGLFLLSLQRLANIQGLGSMGAHDFGRFNLNLTIQDADDTGVPGLPLFNRELGTGAYTLNRSAEVVAEALAAWAAYTDKVTSVELHRFYVPTPKAAKPGRGKKAATATA